MQSSRSVMNRFLILLVSLAACLALPARAQMTTRVVRDSLFIPWELVYGPDQNVWFTQKNGYVCRLNPATRKIDTLAFEPEVVVSGEGGMLGLALHPQFPGEAYVYVAYDYIDGGLYREKVVRYSWLPASDTLTQRTDLVTGITAETYHNGCRLYVFDGKLFITTGDAGNPVLAQDMSSLNGKTLRINLDGSIPADNPIPGNRAWSWGHRNAQGMVRVNNKLYQTEQGASSDDELNVVEKGRNYGWPWVEGFCDQSSEMSLCADSNVVNPSAVWTPTIAVCGVDYYTAAMPMLPNFQNSLLIATIKDESIYHVQFANAFSDSVTSIVPVFGGQFGHLRDLCLSPQGSIFVSTSNSQNGGTPVDQIIEIYDSTKITSVQGTDFLAQNVEVSLSPNPTSASLTATLPPSFDVKDGYRYEIYDALGRKVDGGFARSQVLVLSLADQPSGVYLLRLSNLRGQLTAASFIRH